MKTNVEPNNLNLYLVTDSRFTGADLLPNAVEQAILGGATMIQLREKGTDLTHITTLAKQLKTITDRYNVPLIINDNPYIAAEVDAHGVHLGQGDMTAGEARAILGNDKIIGVSASTPETATVAYRSGADYIGIGSIFPQTTKLDAQPISILQLKATATAVPIPSVAIGGINNGNISQLKDSGINGVAVVSAILDSPDPQRAALQLFISSKDTLVFDFDGTMADSMGAWHRVDQLFVEKHGIECSSKISDKLKTLSFLEGAKWFKQELNLTPSVEEIMNTWNQLADDLFRYMVELKRSVADFIVANKHKKLIIATANNTTLVGHVLDRYNLSDYIHNIFTVEECGINKDNPKFFKDMMEKYYLNPEQCIMFDDAPFAINAAREAGMFTVGVHDEFFEPESEKMKKTANAYITGFDRFGF